MRVLMIFAVLSLLLLGCTTTEQPPALQDNTTPEPEEEMTCQEYCESQPHIQCVGQWDISGTYPDCTCNFVCDVEDTETAPEPEMNETEPELNDTEDEYEPLAQTTDKTMGEMMDDALARLRTDFYRDHSGSYQMDTFTWKKIPLDSAPPGPKDIVIDAAPTTDLEFDGKVVNSVLSSGYVVFTNTDTDERDAYAFAIFEGSTTMLDGYTGPDAFSLWYFSKIAEYEFDDCWTYEKVIEKNPEGTYLSTYYIQCETIEDR